MTGADKFQKIVAWAKRKGFIYPSSEIYGGIGGVYDFGPYGTELLRNIKNLWWQRFVSSRDDIVGIDSSVLMNRKVWQASGHEKGFSDPLVECKKCHQRFRADIVDEVIARASSGEEKSDWENFSEEEKAILRCPKGDKHELTQAKQFNLMFKTSVGSTENSDSYTYFRPETAQGMFVNFKNVLETSRQKLPFGIAQIGKCFRNEITTGEYLFRVREFEIAEIEYFVKPGKDEEWFEYWLKEWKQFLLDLGISEKNLVEHEHPKSELSHYSKRTVDYNYKFPFGEKELTGLANRTDFDLKSHAEASGKDLQYFDQETGKKIYPYVVEPTLGIGRLVLALICEAYEEIKGGRSEAEKEMEKEVIIHFNSKIAPVKIAVFPLTKKLKSSAKTIYRNLKKEFGFVEYDETGSVGRRYRRQDEIGTPYCITYDFDSENDKKVTVRDRDTMKQERIKIAELKKYFGDKF